MYWIPQEEACERLRESLLDEINTGSNEFDDLEDEYWDRNVKEARRRKLRFPASASQLKLNF